MKRAGLLGLLFWLCAVTAWAAEVMPPKPAQYFNDYAGVVSASTAASLNSQLENFEKQTSNQIVVAVFPKMESDSSIEDYTQRVAESWRVGQGKTNNGAVLFVFIQDRKLYIQAGYGLEGALPDALNKRIIDNEITPHFKNGDYDGGLTAGVAAILQAAQGEYKGTGSTANDLNQDSEGLWINIAVFAFIILYIYLRIRYSRGGTVYASGGRRYYGGGLGLLGGGWGGGGGFGGGGGGGGGFSGGGGGFGGGGAGGSW
jgi:uncharacterized protein